LIEIRVRVAVIVINRRERRLKGLVLTIIIQVAVVTETKGAPSLRESLTLVRILIPLIQLSGLC
jgi:hypothetical protein